MSYLVWQRAIDVRMPLETQVTDTAIRFKPSKTAGTSGKALDVESTPQIRAVTDRAKERASVTDGIQFKDCARSAQRRSEGRQGACRDPARLAHTTGKTTEIYIKEAIPETSSLDLKLPW